MIFYRTDLSTSVARFRVESKRKSFSISSIVGVNSLKTHFADRIRTFFGKEKFREEVLIFLGHENGFISLFQSEEIFSHRNKNFRERIFFSSEFLDETGPIAFPAGSFSRNVAKQFEPRKRNSRFVRWRKRHFSLENRFRRNNRFDRFESNFDDPNRRVRQQRTNSFSVDDRFFPRA